MTTLEQRGRRIYFRGSPFAGKDVLRDGGAKWDPDERCWWIGSTKADLAASLAKEADEAASKASTDPKPFRHFKCKQCGARPNARGWPRIYKSGICSDCYRDAHDDC